MYRVVCSTKKRSVKANIIYHICNSCKQVGNGSICYGFRDGKSVTHFLARLDFSSFSSRVWLDVLPKFLGPFIRADISSLE